MAKRLKSHLTTKQETRLLSPKIDTQNKNFAVSHAPNNQSRSKSSEA
jgi:hypothetical protein